MEDRLLNLKLNQFRQQHSMRSATTINMLRQQLAQNPRLDSAQKDLQIFNKKCELRNEAFFGNDESQGIIGIYTNYYTKYPEELTEAKIDDTLKEEISKMEAANKVALLAERQKCAQRKEDEKSTRFYLGLLGASHESLIVKVKEALTINFQTVLKDYKRTIKENSRKVSSEEPVGHL